MDVDKILSREVIKAFETVPDLYLLLSPKLYIITASNAYLKATMMERKFIQGKSILDVFPDNPSLFKSDSSVSLKNSLEWVLKNKKPHQMALQRYDVKSGQMEEFAEKYWQPSNVPVLDENGKIQYIIHKVHDITEELISKKRSLQSAKEFEHLVGQQGATKSQLFAARAEADRQRKRFHSVLMEAPAMICIFEGPNHVFKLVNPAYQQLVGDRPLLGKPIAEAMPELNGQPIFGMLDQVYRTGKSIYAHEMMVQLDHENTGGLGENYYNFTYQAITNPEGKIDGVLVFAYEVTFQVTARKEVEDRERILKKLNEQLRSANEEVKASNEELFLTKLALEDLNTRLEERVKERTKELQQAKSEIEIQRNRLHHLFMQASLPICILSGEAFVYELVNPAYQQLLPGRKLLGNSILNEALSEIANQNIGKKLRQVYKTAETYIAKEELIALSSEEGAPIEDRYFNFTLQARRSQDGRVDGIIVFVYEVTEQVQARKTIERAAEQLQLIADAMPAAITYVNTEQRYQFANKMVQQWRGRPVIGKTMEEVVGEVTYKEIKQYIDQALEGQVVKFNSLIAYTDKKRHVQTDFVPHFEDGKVRGFYTLIVDVSDQVEVRMRIEEREKEAQALAEELKSANEDLSASNEAFKRLAQQQQQLVALVENSSDFIGLATPEGKGQYINQAGLDLMGLEKSMIDKVEVPDFFFDERKHFVKNTILPTSIEKGRWVGEITLRHFQTGKPISVYYNSFSIKEPSTGQILGLAAIILDITERKKQEAELQGLTTRLALANEELSDANEQLIRINVDLDNFIYTASHDLKAPISNIEGLLQVLLRSIVKDGLASEKTKHIINLMQDSVDRFKRTISNLTEVVKLQKENAQVITPLAISEVIEAVLLDLNSVVENTKARFEIDVRNCPPINFSEKNLRSVVYNLVSNALKYRSPKRVPLIKLHCFQVEGFIVFSVEDNGLGMELTEESKLFGMFSRLHDHVEGSGIGLYMVRKMIENAGGKITVESKVDVGSVFKVFFKDQRGS